MFKPFQPMMNQLKPVFSTAEVLVSWKVCAVGLMDTDQVPEGAPVYPVMTTTLFADIPGADRATDVGEATPPFQLLEKTARLGVDTSVPPSSSPRFRNKLFASQVAEMPMSGVRKVDTDIL
jgi:hypothetical protein